MTQLEAPVADLERLVMLELGCEPRDPTAADLVAYLQARPDLAVAVVDGLKVLRPWTRERRGRTYLVRTVGGELLSHGLSEADLPDATAALVAQGWALAGGGAR
jgi:hypothetical protein